LAPNTRANRDMHNLLDNLQANTNKLHAEYIWPNRDIHLYRELVKRFPKIKEEQGSPFEPGGIRGGVLVVYGGDTGQKTPPDDAFIPANKLIDVKADRQREGRETIEFLGEDLLMTELRFLSRGGVRPAVYFTQGRGELDIRDKDPRDLGGSGQLA